MAGMEREAHRTSSTTISSSRRSADGTDIMEREASTEGTERSVVRKSLVAGREREPSSWS